MEKSNRTERSGQKEILHSKKTRLARGKKPRVATNGKKTRVATTSFIVDQMDRGSLSSKNESLTENHEKDRVKEQVGKGDGMYKRDLGACQPTDSVFDLGVVDDAVNDNLANDNLSWGNLFNWDDFGYSLILGFAPTTWDVISDLIIASQLEDDEKDDERRNLAGLSYLFVCLPGLYMLNETLSEVLSDCSSALVHFVTLYSSVFFSSAMIGAFYMDPLLFKGPAILIGIGVVITKGLAIFVHTPEMKKISKRVTMSEFRLETPLQLLLLLHLWVQRGWDKGLKFRAPVLSSLLVIGKVNAETYLSDEPENLMKDKSFLEKLLLTLKHIPFFAVTAFFRIGCVMINNQVLKHTDLRILIPHPTLFFFFTVWLLSFFFLFLYNLIFLTVKFAFPNHWPEITLHEIGFGVIAELTTVSNWGRLGRVGSRWTIFICVVLIVFLESALQPLLSSLTIRWFQFFMATSLLVIDLGLVAMVATLENGHDLANVDKIPFEYSIIMTCAGFASYLLIVFQIFLLPNCLSVSDLFTLYNI